MKTVKLTERQLAIDRKFNNRVFGLRVVKRQNMDGMKATIKDRWQEKGQPEGYGYIIGRDG